MWTEVAVAYFDVLNWHMLAGTEQYHQKPQSELQACEIRTELRYFQIRRKWYLLDRQVGK